MFPRSFAKSRPGRMIRTVDHGVAAEAVACVQLRTGTLLLKRQQPVDGRAVAARQVGAAVHRAGMVRGMAFLAQPRCPRLEQRGIVRAMRGVAGGAVLLHRLVTPQERAAPLGMTGVTG